MVVRGPTVKLSTGAEMPLVGLGTWLSQPGEVGNAVKVALEHGYRHIDTAQVYSNEKEIGNALQEFFKAGTLKREDVFITTKLWANCYRLSEIEDALRESLAKLQLDYVDLYLIHTPAALKSDGSGQDHSVTVEQIWTGMEEVYKKGLTKAIGVSNFSVNQIDRVMKIAKIPIHNSQNECYIYYPQFDLIDTCKRHNIVFTAYAPIGSPGRVQASALEWLDAPSPLKDEGVLKLADKYHKTPAQILIRHQMQRGLVVLAKSINDKRIKENFDIFDFELTDAEVKELNVPKHIQKLFLMQFMKGHPEDPFKGERERQYKLLAEKS